MSQKKSKATRRSISILQQVVTGCLPGWKIAEFAACEKIKAREFSYDAQIYLLMLGQLLHLFSLNELVDVSQIYSSELSRIRGSFQPSSTRSRTQTEQETPRSSRSSSGMCTRS